MKFQVPKYVELEDKLAFRLTLKQLGWFALGGFILFVIWTIFEKWVFWIFFPVVMGVVAAFVFYKPAGLTLFTFLVDGVVYFIRSKKMTWKKESDDISLEDKYGKRKLDTSNDDYEEEIKRKKKGIENAGSLARILDETSDL